MCVCVRISLYLRRLCRRCKPHAYIERTRTDFCDKKQALPPLTIMAITTHTTTHSQPAGHDAHSHSGVKSRAMATLSWWVLPQFCRIQTIIDALCSRTLTQSRICRCTSLQLFDLITSLNPNLHMRTQPQSVCAWPSHQINPSHAYTHIFTHTRTHARARTHTHQLNEAYSVGTILQERCPKGEMTCLWMCVKRVFAVRCRWHTHL